MPVQLMAIILILIFVVGLFLLPLIVKGMELASKFTIYAFKVVKNSLDFDKSLSDKFDDLMHWKEGDTIKYSVEVKRNDFQNTVETTDTLVSFKEDGVFVVYSDNWKQYQLGHITAKQLSKVVDFVHFSRIIENESVPERIKEQEFLKTIEDETSYNNQLIVIQQELEELNEEYANNKPRMRV